MPPTRRPAGVIPLLCLALTLSPAQAQSPPQTPRVHAIVGARIVVAPGQVIARGTVVIRDGVISAVGANVAPPADARIWEGDSLTVYAGLIDAFVQASESSAETAARPVAGGGGGRRSPPPPAPPRGAGHELASVTPEARVVERPPLAREQVEGLREAGFTAAQVVGPRGIVRGQSAVVGLGGDVNAAPIQPDVAQVIVLQPIANDYPGSLMGVVAVVRQLILDARWYRDAHVAYARSPQGKERPELNVALDAMQPVIAGLQPALFVADEMLEVLRAAAIAREAGIAAQVLGAGDEYKRVREIAAAGVPLVIPVNFPEAPDVATDAGALEVPTEELRHWHYAPENPGVLSKNAVTFALTAHGLRDVKGFRSAVGKATERGLGADAALAAVTTVPARLLGLGRRLGTIEAGKIANLTVTRGELFGEKGKVVEVWVDGNRYETGRDDQGAKGQWTFGTGPNRHFLTVKAEKDTTVTLVLGADTLKATAVRLTGARVRFTVRLGSGPAEDFDLTARHDVIRGTLRIGEDERPVLGARAADDEKRGEAASPPGEGTAGARGPARAEKAATAPIVTPVVMGNTEPWRMPRPPLPAAVLVRNATLWTAGPQGLLENADLLVRGGKIAAVGRGLKAPADAVVIDGTGKQVAPGIIDEHSHSAILGNVNECTHSVTAEVRIQDVVNSENVNIYRQLAGGTTAMHLLHGSCNAIGGQCAVIKNKWGEPPSGLLMADARPTIKFALGENPKQSNFDDRPSPPRYPQSRAGVEQTIRDAFTHARDYRAAWADFRAGRKALPPRRDLQLEAVAEVVEGKRDIHCHSYRQDEILMLIRLAEEFGTRVNTFTHVLEGYKVADEMAAHGSSGSTFSDWWAYKYEVIDAIPTNGYLMWDRGVNVCYNSDSDDLARRLNSEAGKAVKYGGVPPAEAIQFVTLNPAKSLGIAQRMGSLEVGKDGDFSVWDGSPLSPFSHCEQTWIEGRKYFDRAQDLAGREALAQERQALIARARAEKKEGGSGGARAWRPRYLEDTDMSGNGCGTGQDADGRAHDAPFTSETLRHALQNGEVQR